MIRYSLTISIAVAIFLLGCGEKIISIGDPPPEPKFSIDKIDENHIIFTVTSAEGFMVNWNFGNGELSQKDVDTMYYPFADTYTVKLTASNKGGATTAAQSVVVKETDPEICANRFYEMISGGCDATSKTWRIADGDSVLANGPPASKDSLGNGTSTYNDPVSFWWNSMVVNDIPPEGATDDRYIFGLKGFTYENDCHGDFYFNWQWTNKLFGTSQEIYADTVHAYVPNSPSTWTLEIDTTGGEGFITDSVSGESFNLILTLSNDNYLGYCSGTSIYQVLEITPDMMFLRFELGNPDDPSETGVNRTEWRYVRLTAE
jgi:PKD repeat protein